MRQFTILLAVAAVGCSRPAPTSPAVTPPSPVASRFDATTAGGVRGRVVWPGEVPAIPQIAAAIPDGTTFRFTSKPNPFAPQVRDGGLAGAVVSLVGVGPAAAKPWPHPPATVEQADHELKVKQGDSTVAGIARVGDAVTVVSRDPGPATIRLRGAAFVTLPLPRPGQADDPHARQARRRGGDQRHHADLGGV